MLKLTSRSLLAVVATFAASVPASAYASEARIAISAFVPLRCEMSFVPASNIDGTLSNIGIVQQYCNTRFQMRFSHAQLSPGAIIGLGTTTAVANGNSTLIEPNGRPTIATSNLWIENNTVSDAQSFANSVVIEVTPMGF